MLAEAQESSQILDEEQQAFLADPGIPDDYVSNAHAVLMANLSNYGSHVISEVPHSEPYHHDMDNQSVHAIQDFEQTPVVDFTDNEITSDSNIILYSQYLQETQQAAEKANQEKNNKSLTAKLEKYKERVKSFEQGLNIDLSTREKMIGSQVDDIIKDKLALKQQIDSLEQNLSNQIKEKESLLQTFTRIKPTLYDGSFISSQHAVIPVIDDEETLILEELNRLSEDFGKHFVSQQELSAEQAFWLQTSHPNTDQYDISPVKIKSPRELPKCFVDKHCFEIHKKEIFPDNDRLLHQIMSQDVMLCVMNSTAIIGDSVNVEMQSSKSCDKCFDLNVELLKKQNAYNSLLKSYS
ncbi:hypothetical protein Tco_1113559 [Tanacetum coccineum]|uniref:Uncharacterized protein n=1 Tax=Tanacetum coccineum TaxID=301880 RepID=A0ABQ5ISH4_9ASTR